jgi:hypothetical protein
MQWRRIVKDQLARSACTVLRGANALSRHWHRSLERALADAAGLT